MDKCDRESREHSYEYKIKQVIVDLKATKPSIGRKKDWDLTDKVCPDGAKIIESIVKREEISKEEEECLKPKKDCHASQM